MLDAVAVALEHSRNQRAADGDLAALRQRYDDGGYPSVRLTGPDPGAPAATLEVDAKGAHVLFARPAGVSSYLFLNNQDVSGTVLIDATGRRVQTLLPADGSPGIVSSTHRSPRECEVNTHSKRMCGGPSLLCGIHAFRPGHSDGDSKTALTSKRAIVIVDDGDLVRSATASPVRSVGEEAPGFSSAWEFLDADLDGVVCVISDVHMSGMSGIEILNELLQRPEALPLLLMTAFPSENLRRQADAAGAIACLEKPVSGDALVYILRQTLAH